MKKRAAFFAIIVFSLLAAAPLLAQENSGLENSADKKNWSFSLEPKIGARIGVCDEIVWAKRKSDGERYKQSELNYQLNPAIYVGADFCASYKKLELKLLSKFFFSQKTGTLKDSDWQNDSICANGDIDTKTDYSEHSLYLAPQFAGIAGFDMEFQADLKFRPANFLTLAPLVSVNAQCLNFRAKGGMGWYGTYDKDRRSISSCSDPSSNMTYFFGDRAVLEYQVYNFFVWTGIRADFKVNSSLSVSLASELSPLSALLDFDKHLTNNRQFKEFSLSSCFAFRQTIKTQIFVNQNLSFCQACSFIFTGESEGSMYIKNSNESSYSKVNKNSGGGGNQFICLDLELSAKIAW